MATQSIFVTISSNSSIYADDFTVKDCFGSVIATNVSRASLISGQVFNIDVLCATVSLVSNTISCNNTTNIPIAATTTTTTTTTSTTTTTTTAPSDIAVNVSNGSLDIQITSVYVNSSLVSYVSGSTFDVGPAESGVFSSNQMGTYTIDVYYTSSISGQNINIVDCLNNSFCCTTNGGGGVCTFTNADTTCGISVSANDGACL